MKFKIIHLIVLSLLVLSFACNSHKNDTDFVKTNGTHFEIDGKPYYFMGTNYWYGAYLGMKESPGDRERLQKELDQLKQFGITNLRVLAGSNLSSIHNSLKPAFQKAPGDYNEELLDGLDYLLSEMDKRGMHAVLFLTNYWEWSGGMSQYLAWENDGKLIDPAVDNNWSGFMNYSKEFYTNPSAEKVFRQYVNMLLTRQNNYTGKFYREDPAIMAWELANEPRPGNGAEGLAGIDTLVRWVNETAMFIKSVDPNHLVTTGSEGLAGCMESSRCYINEHSSNYIDYATVHLWAKNWGWFKADSMEQTLVISIHNAADYLNKHIAMARKINKPLVLEEFGLGRDYENFDRTAPVTARNRYYKNIFSLMYDSAAMGAPVAGINFWAYGGAGRAQNEDYKWQLGDPFTGDPPQEPQGLNSVFDTDTSTLNIIHNYAEKFMSLETPDK